MKCPGFERRTQKKVLFFPSKEYNVLKWIVTITFLKTIAYSRGSTYFDRIDITSIFSI